jgi:outer membrane receptor for ferrienterochelin and colicin
MSLKLRFLSAFLLFILPIIVYAGTTGKIAGVITDKTTGEALPGVNVIIDGTTLGASTDLEGAYVILNIPPGTYTIVAQYIGYSEYRIENVKINIDLTTELTFALQEAMLELDEAVVVIAERELVTKDLTASTASVDAEEIAILPITEISEALELQAGYVDGHVRGGRTGEIAYWIDGVPVTDSYDGGQVVEVNKDAVEQLQFVSGAFNAEYGQAMSGIVNITTKEPRVDFGGNFTTYFGDFVSVREFDRNNPTGNASDDVFLDISGFDPTNIRNFEGSLFGSIVPGKLSYFLTARHIYFSGFLYGQRVYQPHNISFGDNQENFVQFRDSTASAGDGDFIPMNWNEKFYVQAKLIYHITPVMKLTYSYIRDDVEFEEYDRAYKLNPDGNLNRFRIGNTHLFKLSHTLGATTFYDLGISFFDKSYQQYVYEDPFDPRYVHPKINENQLSFSFKTGGTNNQHFFRETKTTLVKLDLTSQITKTHMIKTGLEFRRNSIFFDDITLRPANDEVNLETDSPYMIPVIEPVGSLFHDQYQHTPLELSAYIQDKMEFEDFIVNVGVRIDYFEPDAQILSDFEDPDILRPLKQKNIYKDLNGNGIQDIDEPFVSLAERQAYWYKDATSKTQISPRLGASFPITATGIIHFSYGHFFQIPNFELLYRNPQFKLESGTGNLGVIGNSDLRPEQTIQGEIGLQQQLGSELALDVTLFFRDVRDLTGTRAEQIQLISGDTYSRLVNSDFGFIKGFIVSFRNRFKQGFNYTLDYTFQVAEGTASDPEQARNAFAGGGQPEVQLAPLSWDQRHTLNATLSYNAPDWGVSFIGNLGSGQPYTPRQGADVATIRENSETKPTRWNVDMRAFKDFELFGQNLTVFLRVLNLFDQLNEVNVFNDTGRGGFTTDLDRDRKTNPPEVVNSLEEWHTNMTHFSEPRRIEFGLMFDF